MFSATDISTFLSCRHAATLKRAELRQEVTRPFFADPALDLLRKLGLEHEHRYLRTLAEDEHSIAEIALDSPWAPAMAKTIKALHQGVDVVYQGVFLDEGWGGRPDFLTRVDLPSELGPWSYEPVETKLARSTKAGALLQLCLYSELVSRIQGTEPQRMHIVLGGGAAPEKFPVQHYIAYFRKIQSEFEEAWRLESETVLQYPDSEAIQSISFSAVLNQTSLLLADGSSVTVSPAVSLVLSHSDGSDLVAGIDQGVLVANTIPEPQTLVMLSGGILLLASRLFTVGQRRKRLTGDRTAPAAKTYA